MHCAAIGALVLLLASSAVGEEGLAFEALESGSSASLRGLCVVDKKVAWASGSGASVLRTTDGGRTWTARAVPVDPKLEFRDVEAWDADRAVVLGAGTPAKILGTEDGGATWRLAYTDDDPAVFFDGMAFWDRRRGLAFSDPVHGHFVVLLTDDGGRSWRTIPPETLPAPLEGEAGFAASGTNVAVLGDKSAWIATGGRAARVLRTLDGGKSWTVAGTPVLSGEPSTGIFSLAFFGERSGIAVGGDYRRPDHGERNVAVTSDGGESWTGFEGDSGSSPRGFRSCVAMIPGTEGPTLVAVGSSGADVSFDGGKSWIEAGNNGYHVVDFAADGTGLSAGADGRIARVRTRCHPDLNPSGR